MSRRDAALLLVAAAVIFALMIVSRGTPHPTTDSTAWRELIDVDYA